MATKPMREPTRALLCRSVWLEWRWIPNRWFRYAPFRNSGDISDVPAINLELHVEVSPIDRRLHILIVEFTWDLLIARCELDAPRQRHYSNSHRGLPKKD